MTKRVRWYARPAPGTINPKTEREYAGNHAVPRVAWRTHQAHTTNEQRIYEFLERRGRLIANGRRLFSISLAQLAKALEMPKSTVRNCLRTLRAKHSLVQWDVDTSQPKPRQRGDHGDRTTWMIPSYVEALQLRRDDPNVGTARGNCYVIGKGRRFCTPAELVIWKVDAIVAERFSQSEPAPPAEASPAATSSPPDLATEGTGSRGSPPEIAPEIIGAFRSCIRDKSWANKAAHKLVRKVRAMAAARGHEVTDAEIVDAIYLGWRNAGRKVAIFGFFERSLPEKIEALIEQRERSAGESKELEKARQQALSAPMTEIECPVCDGTGGTGNAGQCGPCAGSGRLLVPMEAARAAG